MIELVTLLGPLFATGFGSFFKMAGSYLDRRDAIAEAKEKRKLVAAIERGKINAQIQEQIFGNHEAGAYARVTRRTLAIMGMCLFCAIGWVALVNAEQVYQATITTTSLKDWFFGISQVSTEEVVLVPKSLGGFVEVCLAYIGIIIGFYFTPGGRK